MEQAGSVAADLVARFVELEIERRGLLTPAWCAGQRRPHRYGARLFAAYDAGGHLSVVLACVRCAGGRRQIQLERIRNLGLVPSELEVIADARELTVCAKCGRDGAELHHWAPRSLFEDADEWPTDPLCVGCHRRWHDTTGVATGSAV